MSTLRVDEEALEQAVEPFASVAGLRIRADFPHDLRVEVIEHEPVATRQDRRERLPATGGGLLLDGVRADGPADRDDEGAARRPPRERRRARSRRCGSPPPRRPSCAPAPSGSCSGRAA